MSIDADAAEPIPEFAPEDLHQEYRLLNLAKYASILGATVWVTYTETIGRRERTAEFEVVDQQRATGGPFRFRALELDPLVDDEDVLHTCTLHVYSHLKKHHEGAQFPKAVGHATDVRVRLDGGGDA
ncbi:hypothetical protein [Halorubellus salinus]|uniref:hypothetical protein n=1 Tax=Halorubellus salinus TaxID=755309 RepID=UPI001D05D596|nr:hypothetical protein [Halorubellus salinus]